MATDLKQLCQTYGFEALVKKFRASRTELLDAVVSGQVPASIAAQVDRVHRQLQREETQRARARAPNPQHIRPLLSDALTELGEQMKERERRESIRTIDEPVPVSVNEQRLILELTPDEKLKVPIQFVRDVRRQPGGRVFISFEVEVVKR